MIKKTNYIHTLLTSALLVGGLCTPLLADARAAKLFKEHCSNCHGDGGQPTALGIALHARDLTIDSYKQGDSVEDIMKTLVTGVPGSGMVPFTYLSVADRQLVAEHLYRLRHGVDAVVEIAKAKVTQAVEETKAVVAAEETKAVVAVEETKAVVKAKVTPVIEATKKEVVHAVAKVEHKSVPAVAQVKEVAHAVKSAASSVKAQIAKVVAPVKAKAVASGLDMALIAQGRDLYKKGGCAVCHGEDGLAKTPTGMALKARNLIADTYKMGATVEGISGVLEKGLAGTAMVAYPQFDAEQRKAIANYILFLRNPPKDTAKALPEEAKAGSENPLITEGRKLYVKNGCASCHGINGQADNPTGMALKARNFVVGEYKMGATIEGISGVLQNGLGGTAMAAYPNLDADQRIAIATFLLALKGHPEVATSPEPKVASSSGKTSIAYAMSVLSVTPIHQLSFDFQDGSAGADIYNQNCASCHGAQGQGGIATRMVSAAPYYRVKTSPLLGHDGDWMKEANFKKIVIEGTPGKLMPGMGTLTQQKLSDLYSFFKSALEKSK